MRKTFCEKAATDDLLAGILGNATRDCNQRALKKCGRQPMHQAFVLWPKGVWVLPQRIRGD